MVVIGLNAILPFFASRLGMAAIAAALGCYLGYSAANQGAKVRALQSDNAALAREIAQAKADLARANAAATQAAAEADALRTLQQDLAEKVKSYEAELEARRQAAVPVPAECDQRDACRLDRNDVERLRDIK